MVQFITQKPFKLAIFTSAIAIAPGLIGCLFLLPYTGFDQLESLTFLVFIVLGSSVAFLGLYFLMLRPWQSVANVLRGCLEGDFTQRMMHVKPSDPIGLVAYELNELIALLQSSRFKFIETRELLLKVLDSVDVSVFLFDHRQRLVMSNRAGSQLYHATPDEMLGKTMEQLDLSFANMALPNTSHEHQFPARKSKWLVKRSSYRDAGFSHKMILLNDIGINLREEELTAWKRLIRVLSHEINNTMTPMKATVGGLQRMLRADLMDHEWRRDFEQGLTIIERRVENLNHHVRSYTQIARQPQPRKNWLSLADLVTRIVSAYKNDSITLNYSDDLCLYADESQIEQVLINLINNAIEASETERANAITVSWYISNNNAYLFVKDTGCGIENFDNIFIPYFTTKKQGSGVGLFVSRQIIEAHDGFIHLENCQAEKGCLVTICLPLLLTGKHQQI